MEKPTHRLTVHLDNGTSLITEDTFEDDDALDAAGAVVQEIEDRDNPWKFLGHLVVNFRNIVAVEVEAL
jgi:hypothetical protein